MPPLDYVGTPAVEADTAGRDEQLKSQAASSDSMPPLDYVGNPPAQGDSGARNEPPQGKSISEDSMPPLDYVGAAPLQGAGGSSGRPLKGDTVSEDSMPPLDYVGASQAEADSRAKCEEVTGDAATGDPMPGLNYVDTAPAHDRNAELKVGDIVELKSLSKAELNGQRGVVLGPRDSGTPDRLTVKLSSSSQKVSIKRANLERMMSNDLASDDSMPPLDYVGATPLQGDFGSGCEPPKGATRSDDSMPPLDFAGAAPTQGHSIGEREQKQFDTTSNDSMPPLDHIGGATGEKVASDDSMPPLDYVEVAPTQADGGNRSEMANPESASNDSMPPLDYVGVSPGTGGASDDSMPPLDYVHVAPAQAASCGRSEPLNGEAVSDDSMPSLDYVGEAVTQKAAPSQHSISPGTGGSWASEFKVGDVVTLRRLSMAEYNGQKAVVLPVSSSTQVGRLPVRICSSGVHLHVELQNVENEDHNSNDSMPPLEYVNESDRPMTMPTSPAVEEQGHPASTRGGPTFVAGSSVILHGLENEDYNGQLATVLPHAGGQWHPDRLAVRLVKTGQKLSVRREKLDQAPKDDLASKSGAQDDSAETAEHTYDGSNAKSLARGASAISKLLRPDQARASAPVEANAGGGSIESWHTTGSKVILRGCPKAPELNGRHGTVLAQSKAHSGQLHVKLTSGKRVLVSSEYVFAATPKGQSPKAAACPPVSVEKAAVSTPPAAAPPPSPPQQPSAEELLDRMKEASQSNSEKLISEIIASVDSAKDIDWGDLMSKKKSLMKKLRAKKRKYEDAVRSPESGPGARGTIDGGGGGEGGGGGGDGAQRPEQVAPNPAAHTAVRSAQGASATGASESDHSKQSNQSEKTWVHVKPSPKLEGITLKSWCEELGIPGEVLQRLEAEDVRTPQELAHVPEDDLMEFARGLKMGPKARFLQGVRELR